jgi:hypothetical protein
LKILKWKSSGKITQIEKHNDEPMNAIILSNAGKIIAMMTTRMIVLVRRRMRRGVEGGEDGDKRVSSVEFIGRDARGTFVRGIMAMNIEMRRVRGRG